MLQLAGVEALPPWGREVRLPPAAAEARWLGLTGPQSAARELPQYPGEVVPLQRTVAAARYRDEVAPVRRIVAVARYRDEVVPLRRTVAAAQYRDEVAPVRRIVAAARSWDRTVRRPVEAAAAPTPRIVAERFPTAQQVALFPGPADEVRLVARKEFKSKHPAAGHTPRPRVAAQPRAPAAPLPAVAARVP